MDNSCCSNVGALHLPQFARLPDKLEIWNTPNVIFHFLKSNITFCHILFRLKLLYQITNLQQSSNLKVSMELQRGTVCCSIANQFAGSIPFSITLKELEYIISYRGCQRDTLLHWWQSHNEKNNIYLSNPWVRTLFVHGATTFSITTLKRATYKNRSVVVYILFCNVTLYSVLFWWMSWRLAQ